MTIQPVKRNRFEIKQKAARVCAIVALLCFIYTKMITIYNIRVPEADQKLVTDILVHCHMQRESLLMFWLAFP